MITLQADYYFGATAQGNSCLGPGWAPPEPDFVWSIGSESTLLVPNPKGRGATVLELRIEPFIAPPRLPHQHASVWVNNISVGRRRLDGPCTWRIALPRVASAPDVLSVRIARAENRLNPALLGLPDPRDLGFKLTRLKVLTDDRPPFPPVRRWHTHFRFGWNEPTAGFLHDGWGHPEDGYVWAIGHTSTLCLPVEDMPRPATLLLDMRPVHEPSGATRQRLAIGANGRLLRYVDLRERVILAMDINPDPHADALALHFDNIDAYADPGRPTHQSGLPFAWALASARLAPRPAAVAPATLPRLAGHWADGTLAHAVSERCGLSMQDLVTRFDSIAGSCRLGNLQRRLDRDQVGLLRYAAMHQHELVEGILAGFADVGRPDALLWDVRGPEDTTWRLIDQVFRISFATPYPLAADPPADAIAKFGRTLPRLAAKLMEDIAAANKIFITRLIYARLIYDSDDAAALALLTALRHFGDAWLLVLDDTGAAEPGSVERRASGILVGHLDAREDVDLDAADTSLISVLANALALTTK